MYHEINETMARRSNEMMSFDDYREGSATAEYRGMVDKAAAIAKKQKEKVDPMYHEKIDNLLELYSLKLAENMNKSYEIGSRCPSIMIAGGSNFPIKKKEKQIHAMDKNLEEWNNIQGLLNKIRSIGTGGISSDDPNAIDKLKAKLANMEKTQQTMKEVNAYYRKNKTLDGCPNLSFENIEKLKAGMSSNWHIENKPYPSWALSNNNANIRRVKERIAELENRQSLPVCGGWNFNGDEVIINADENRVQILFDEKPDENIRTKLKSHGFRWSPRQGVWQRLLNNNGIVAAREVTKNL